MTARLETARPARADHGDGIDWLASTDWVDAAPFAAHLRHLWAETALPWRVLAAAAGVPAATVRGLLRGGRRRRIRTVDAWAILLLSSEQLRRAHTRVVNSAPTATYLQALTDAGMSVSALASALAIGERDVTELLTEQMQWCTQELAWRTEAICDAVDVETASTAEPELLAA